MAPYADSVDKLGTERAHMISVFHISSHREIAFKAFVTDFTDSYNSNWATEDTYGRMDPIATFQNTVRTVSISWDVVAGNLEEAKSNLLKCELLLSMLYPTYTTANAAVGSNIQQAPFLKAKFSNLMCHPGAGNEISAKSAGLMGFFNGFDYKPDFESGVFQGNGMTYPKIVSMSGQYQVIHQFALGWDELGEFRQDGFPYKIDPPIGSKFVEGISDWFQEATDNFLGGGNATIDFGTEEGGVKISPDAPDDETPTGDRRTEDCWVDESTGQKYCNDPVPDGEDDETVVIINPRLF